MFVSCLNQLTLLLFIGTHKNKSLGPVDNSYQVNNLWAHSASHRRSKSIFLPLRITPKFKERGRSLRMCSLGILTISVIIYSNDHHNNWHKVKAGEETSAFALLRIKGRKKKSVC